MNHLDPLPGEDARWYPPSHSNGCGYFGIPTTDGRYRPIGSMRRVRGVWRWQVGNTAGSDASMDVAVAAGLASARGGLFLSVQDLTLFLPVQERTT